VLTINEPAVIYDSMDEEVVAIHYETGRYYCITGSGSRIWALIGQGVRSRDALVEQSVALFAEDTSRARKEIDAFIGDLIREDLVVLKPDSAPLASGTAGVAPREKVVYAPPELQVFDDMQRFLLQDPVHNIERAEWPKQARVKRTE